MAKVIVSVLCLVTSLTVLWSLVDVDCFELHHMSPRVVFTKQGPVQGFLGPADTGIYHTPHYSGGSSGSGFDMRHFSGKPIVEIFRGIPYASPPTGPLLRYESPAPLPHRSRTEVFNANVSRPSCPRTSEEVLNRTGIGTGRPGGENIYKTLRKTLENSVEDCLYLDIYAPLNSIYYNAGDKNKGNGLAVLVFMNSHPDDPRNPFDGSSVAAIGNIIVISVRYRTGVLGFLQPSYSEDVRSNFGLWDQLAALQWIKENIGEFGGDSSNISLMGFDIDATVAGLLALSPVSQAYNGLFHRLILINGSPFAPNAINPEPIRTTYQLARALPCPTDERSGDLAKCLRAMPVPRLVTAAEKNIGAPPLTFPFSPIADGIIVPHEMSQPSPAGSPSVQEMLRKYDILIGLKEGPVLPRVGRHTLNNIDLDRFITAVIKLTMKMESGAEPTPEVKRVIRNAIINDQGYGTSPPMRELISDFLIVQPIIDLLNAHSKTDKNTFFYVFKDFDPLNINKMDEISYIFSSNVYKWKYTGSPSHTFKLHTFVMLISLLANFVRNGDPNISDPSDRFQSSSQPWPQYTEQYGRYLEIAGDIAFPSGYRKHSTDFWGKTFHAIMKTFANKSLVDGSSSTFPEFPPHFTSRNYEYNHPSISSGGPGTDLYPSPEDSSENQPSVILGGQSTIVLVGCLLLLLNFCCFMGLFYQRERLKKAELQLRKRYILNQQQAQEQHVTATGNANADLDGVEASSSFAEVNPTTHANAKNPQSHHNHVPVPNRKHPNLRDNLSETETENGFGPDFLGPNYDPRTKVNRWMQMQQQQQQQNQRLLGLSLGDEQYSNTPTPSEVGMIPSQPQPPLNYGPPPHPHRLQRLSRVREDETPPWAYENPYETSNGHGNGPLYQAIQPHPQQIIGLGQVPPSYLLTTPGQSQGGQPIQQPLQIHVNSLQRGQQHRPPKAVPDPPVQFIPQLPYQEPFKPSAGMGSDIPYADSRATSPSIISAPAGFSSTSRYPYSYAPPPQNHRQNPHPAEELIELNSTPSSSTPTDPHPPSTSTKIPTTTKGHDPDPTGSVPMPKGILVTSQPNKRSSTLIVRDLDPPEPDSEPKYVPVKTGTLTRSVGVGVDTRPDGEGQVSGDLDLNGGGGGDRNSGGSSFDPNTSIESSSSANTIVAAQPNNNTSSNSSSNDNSSSNPTASTLFGRSANPTSQVRVTFKENL